MVVTWPHVAASADESTIHVEPGSPERLIPITQLTLRLAERLGGGAAGGVGVLIAFIATSQATLSQSEAHVLPSMTPMTLGRSFESRPINGVRSKYLTMFPSPVTDSMGASISLPLM